MVRKATLRDAKAILKLIEYYSKKNIMLPRRFNEVCEAIRDFWVYDDGKVSGCAALHVYANDLAEVRSLAVENARRAKGIGSDLLAACLSEAKELGIKKVFALTVTTDFFKKHGFKKIEKSNLPQKIWSDCVVCVKFDRCDEVSYIKRL